GLGTLLHEAGREGVDRTAVVLWRAAQVRRPVQEEGVVDLARRQAPLAPEPEVVAQLGAIELVQGVKPVVGLADQGRMTKLGQGAVPDAAARRVRPYGAHELLERDVAVAGFLAAAAQVEKAVQAGVLGAKG